MTQIGGYDIHMKGSVLVSKPVLSKNIFSGVTFKTRSAVGECVVGDVIR